MVTPDHLRRIAGADKCHPLMSQIADAFNEQAALHGVNTPRRIAQFLGNVAHENGGFTKLTESLNYSPQGLIRTFNRTRISVEQAERFGRKPGRPADQKALANILYGGEWGKRNLGNINPDDGWDFRGSGIGQPTGRANFARAEKATGIPFTSNPDLMRDVDNSMRAALTLWQQWGLNEMADRGETAAIRRKWNGGRLGLAEVSAAVNRGLDLNLSVPVTGPEEIEPLPPVPAAKPSPAAPAAAAGGIAAVLAAALWWLPCHLPQGFIDWAGYAARCVN